MFCVTFRPTSAACSRDGQGQPLSDKLSAFRVRLHQRGEGFVTFPSHGAQLRILCHQLLESPELQADGDAGADP